MDLKQPCAEEWLEAFTTKALSLRSFDQQLEKLEDAIQHPSLPSLSTSLRNSWSLLSTVSHAESALLWSRAAAEFTWEQLNTGDWKDVAVEWRQCYSLSALLTAMALVRKGELQVALFEVDKALLMGAPVLENALNSLARTLVADIQKAAASQMAGRGGKLESDRSDNDSGSRQCVDQQNPVVDGSAKKAVVFKNYKLFRQRTDLCSFISEGHTSELPHPKKPRWETAENIGNASPTDSTAPCSSHTVFSGSLLTNHTHTVPVVHCPSLEAFLQQYMLTSIPVVVSGCMDLWPAYAEQKWSLNYLKAVAGPRTVPVELGSQYTDEEWSQKLMTITDFIDQYIIEDGSSGRTGYLAQHRLFDQIPELRDDIVTPDYCYLHTAENLLVKTGEGVGAKVNAWFGPKGTVSPLHYDPEHNLLAQVLGRKFIRLYSKDQTPYLYPHEGLLTNTSQVDIERPDLEQFPKFSKAVPLECTLHPGQMLYIPPGCWHFVRSLDISFSVSFWWS